MSHCIAAQPEPEDECGRKIDDDLEHGAIATQPTAQRHRKEPKQEERNSSTLEQHWYA